MTQTIRRSLTAVVVGSLFLRAASAATGGMLLFYLAHINQEARPISELLVGFMAASFYASELVGAPIAGIGSDRWGRKRFVLLGPLLGLIAVQLTAVTTLLPLGVLLPVLLFTRVLEGLSTATNAPATLSYLSLATVTDEGVRGRVMALFEVASIAGLAVGYVGGGVLWDTFQVLGFALIGIIYMLSFLIYWRGMVDQKDEFAGEAAEGTLRDRLRLFMHPDVRRLAPAWLSVNAAIGLWMSHLLYQMKGEPRFPDQLLVGGFSGSEAGGLFAGMMLIFSLGIYLWGRAFTLLRKTTIMLWSCAGLFLIVGALAAINHLPAYDHPGLWPLMALLSAALLLSAGFTPASLGYLSDVAEGFAANRGAVMGLYSILLALGQLLGGYGGGPFAAWLGIDGMLIFTGLLSAVSLYTVVRLHQSPPPMMRLSTQDPRVPSAGSSS